MKNRWTGGAYQLHVLLPGLQLREGGREVLHDHWNQPREEAARSPQHLLAVAHSAPQDAPQYIPPAIAGRNSA